jgi:hypothetical protein
LTILAAVTILKAQHEQKTTVMKTLNLILTTTIIAFSLNCFSMTNSKMSGTFTIGNKAGADFKTISEAVMALEIIGVSGPVTFMVDKDEYKQNITVNVLQTVATIGGISFINADEDYSTASNTPTEDGTSFSSK